MLYGFEASEVEIRR